MRYSTVDCNSVRSVAARSGTKVRRMHGEMQCVLLRDGSGGRAPRYCHAVPAGLLASKRALWSLQHEFRIAKTSYSRFTRPCGILQQTVFGTN